MDEIIELLKYTVPSLVVFVATYFIMKKFMDNEYRKQMVELRKGSQKVVTPLRLQASERLVLFLERISLNNLVARVNRSGMDAKWLQTSLIQTVRHEFEHNLTQQLYISGTTWETIRTSKEEIIKVINIAASQVPKDATSLELAQKIFEIMTKLENSPTQHALDVVKKEVRQFF